MILNKLIKFEFKSFNKEENNILKEKNSLKKKVNLKISIYINSNKG
jgi:hypothetical protein